MIACGYVSKTPTEGLWSTTLLLSFVEGVCFQTWRKADLSSIMTTKSIIIIIKSFQLQNAIYHRIITLHFCLQWMILACHTRKKLH